MHYGHLPTDTSFALKKLFMRHSFVYLDRIPQNVQGNTKKKDFNVNLRLTKLLQVK